MTMQFEVYRNNGGQFHWRLVEKDGLVLAVSAAGFASEQAARESVDAIRPHTGLQEPGR
jgi:uncharacterized protein YegP (UPF0339 family)